MQTRHPKLLLVALLMALAASTSARGETLLEAVEAGRCVPAFSQLKEAAEQGQVKAMLQFGVTHYYGWCNAKDLGAAAAWMRRAAEKGNDTAQFNLGVSYDNGQGVAQDSRQAAGWYRKAAEQGNSDAPYRLGGLYYFGRGLTKDLGQAATWYQRAAEKGNADAQYDLALMYDKGEGVKKDHAQAAGWYRKAADQGEANARNNLALFYEKGDGVRRDLEEAARLYALSARQGDSWGQRNFARMLRDGTGAPANAILAHAWFNLAAVAERPHPNAAKEGNDLASGMSAVQLADAQRLAREWKPGQAMGTPRVKTVALRVASAQTPFSPFPGRPAARPGVTTCNTSCSNGSCYRTYDNGRQMHFQTQRKFNAFTSQWEFDAGSC